MSSESNPEDPIFSIAELSCEVFESSIDSTAQIEDQRNIELSMVLESLRRVAEYSGDIAGVRSIRT